MVQDNAFAAKFLRMAPESFGGYSCTVPKMSPKC
jgi:hypothetical protein